MADMKTLFLFGVLLQMFLLCCVRADDDGYYGEEHLNGFHGVSSLSGVAIVAIVFGLTFLVLLKICCFYWRSKGRVKVITRINTLHRTVPVVIRDSNPKHAGYDQGMIQQTSPPPYMGVMPQNVVPGQGHARANKEEIGTSPPPSHSEGPDETK